MLRTPIDTNKIVTFSPSTSYNAPHFLGGCPKWLWQATWPVTTFGNCPMTFIGQITIPKTWHRCQSDVIAFLFYNNDSKVNNEYYAIYQSGRSMLNTPVWYVDYQQIDGPCFSNTRQMFTADASPCMEQVAQQLQANTPKQDFLPQLILTRTLASEYDAFKHNYQDILSIPAQYLPGLGNHAPSNYYDDLLDNDSSPTIDTRYWYDIYTHPHFDDLVHICSYLRPSSQPCDELTTASSQPAIQTTDEPTSEVDDASCNWEYRQAWLLHAIDSGTERQNPRAQFGGKPKWLHKPAWPALSITDTHIPFTFIMQCDVQNREDTTPKRVFLFLHENYLDDFDNSLIALVQTPDTSVPSNYVATWLGYQLTWHDTDVGPSFCSEHLVTSTSIEERIAITAKDRPDYDHPSAYKLSQASKIGGYAGFVQQPQAPVHPRLLLQIDGNSEVICNASHPAITLDDMVIYIFESLDSGEVAVIWQC